MFFRTFSYEVVIKFILLFVLGVLVLNIYILSVIFTSESYSHKPTIKEDGVYIKREPIKNHAKDHSFKHNAKKAVFPQTNTTKLATKKILEYMTLLKKQVGLGLVNHLLPVKFKHTFYTNLEHLKEKDPTSSQFLKEAHKWVSGRQLQPEICQPPIGQVLNSLVLSRIEKAENMASGTQLKLLLSLEGGVKAVFKPQWYKRTEVMKGAVYAGKDRHNGEVAAFHLAWLLGLRRVPLTVGRRLNLIQEIVPHGTLDLLKTFHRDGNNTCFYGVCYYCNPQDPVCASNDTLEGVLILMLPQEFSLKKVRHPWQRTYKQGVPARWELDASYCKVVRKLDSYSRGPRLLDIIDTAVFDFLIDNGDRHHYELFQHINDSAVLFIDNGKSFGNPDEDHIDILAPLYQCCRLRRTTWTRLLWLNSHSLGQSLRQMLEPSVIAPVLAEPHYSALDRRLLLIIATVNVCIKERNGYEHVIVAD